MASFDRLFLVDGHALIYRAFFAMIQRPLTTSRGENTSAVWGTANFLFRLFEEHHPTYLAWVHDQGDSFRHRTFPQYKATRQKLDQALQNDFDQSVHRVRQMLDAWSVPLVTVDGYEADDVIGTLASQAVDAGLDVVIVSGDKDFYQLIGPHVALLNPGRGGPAAVDEQWVDVSNAADRLGVPPDRVIDFLALVGDSSDNVPGVPGVGKKTALSLIEQYGTLESIIERAAEVKGKRAREAIQSHENDARLSKKLVTIQRDVPVSFAREQLAIAPPDRDTLRAIFTELEFESLIPRLGRAADAVAVSEVEVVDDEAGIAGAIERLRKAPIVGVYVVTLPLSAHDLPLVGLALADSIDHAWYFPFAHRRPDGELIGDAAPRNLSLGDAALKPVVSLLEDAGVPKAGHGVKTAVLCLRERGLQLNGLTYDTALAGFLIDPGRRSYTLDSLLREKLGRELPALGRAGAKAKRDRPLAEHPVPEVGHYAGASASAVLALRSAYQGSLEAAGLQKLLDEIEMPLVRVLADMEWLGIRIDVDFFHDLSREFARDLADLEARIHEAAGTDFNINSTQQLRHVLFEKLQLPVLKRTKTGPSTDAGVLEQLAGLDHEVPKLMLEYREFAKLRSTYVDALPARVNKTTARIHTSFNQTGAATGRLSSSEPNLQNIPVRTARGERIRQGFVANDGCVFLVADYSQIELRLLAHLSRDPAFVSAFTEGGDIHRQTASIIFGVPLNDVTPEMRAQAKTINFATIYGQGPFALSAQLGISQEEARDFITQYFERFAGVRSWLDRTIEEARERGYVTTILGRRRYIPEIQDRKYNVRAFGERTATNSPLQGSAADLIKVAMIGVHHTFGERNLAAAMLLQVHDELVVEVPETELDAAQKIVQNHMEAAADLEVPLVVSVGVGRTWLAAKQ